MIKNHSDIFLYKIVIMLMISALVYCPEKEEKDVFLDQQTNEQTVKLDKAVLLVLFAQDKTISAMNLERVLQYMGYDENKIIQNQ